MFSVSTVLGQKARGPPTWGSPEEHLPSFLAVAHRYTGQEEDNYTKACLVRRVFLFCFVFRGVCMARWEWMRE